jgi:O-antigen ligase
LTAHNSILLSAAETGLFGAVLWAAVIYLSLKIPWRIWRDMTQPEALAARTWALALLAAMAGIFVGALFLTFNYHFVLWIYVGLTAALWAAVKRHQPDFSIHFGSRDLFAVGATTLGVLAAIFVATRWPQ